MKAVQACVLGASLLCDQVFARSISDLIGQLQASSSKGKLEVLESKEMHGCFFADDEYECSWTKAEWERVLDVIIGLATDRHPDVRALVARYMSVSTDARTTEPLGHMLKDSDYRVRIVALDNFLTVVVRDNPNVPARLQKMIIHQLEALLKDESPTIRRAAAAAMIQNGTTQSLQKLKKAHRRESDQATKAVMADVILQLEEYVSHPPVK